MANREPIFSISKRDQKEYIEIIKDYLVCIESQDPKKAVENSLLLYNNIIYGMDFFGALFPDASVEHFDERLRYCTKDFYIPPDTRLKKYKIKKPANVSGERNGASNEKEIQKIRKDLIENYPFLQNRADLQDSIDNYCFLCVMIKDSLKSGDAQSVQIKNLVDAQIRLGTYLGIHEGKRQELRLAESKDNIASLVLQFENTFDDYPELREKFKYYELRLLLQKYDRGEISPKMFSCEDYAGVPVEEAKDFVSKLKTKYGD